MRPLDPRLLRHASAVRPFVLACAALGGLTALLVLAQAELLAKTITWAFLGGAALRNLLVPVGMLLLVVLARSGIAWLSETTAHRAAARALSQLRETVIGAALRIGPRQADRSPAEVASLATHGVDRLEGYFARYLPQLLIASVVPLVVGVRILLADWVAAVIVGLTVPLIPLFMILIGLYTQRDVRRQWKTLSLLGNHFLDLVAGLAELTAFGRARAQLRSLREITEKYRTQTLKTLRVAFLSALALELLATLSVAVVAVSIGLRLLAGDLDLHTALVVLILAPEVYLPLRAVGARFHDSAEGLAAAEEIIALADTPAGDTGTATVPDLTRVALRCEDVTVEGRSGPILDGFSLRVPPGEVVGVTGPSGAGKSTLLDVLLGWRRPDSGRVLAGDTDLADVGRATWHRHIAWVPQQPHLVAGTVAENIRLGSPDASDDEVLAAADVAALDVALDTTVGELGAGLSTGQRRRVALARAVLLDRPLILLDEPTEGVDAETEAAILDRLPKVLAGRTAVIISQHPAVLAGCDRVVTLGGPASAVAPSPDAVPASAAPARPVTLAPAVDLSTVEGSRSKWRPLLDAVRPHRWRLALACLAATAALGCGVALTATSSWLIAGAALHPPVLSLMVAIVAVRTFGLAKGVLRYIERLLSHDVALRALTELRVRVWAQLVRIGPARTARLRRGDLLNRLVSDVDSQQDVLVRGLVPGISTFAVLAGTALTLGVILPGAGFAAAIGLFAAGVLAPLVAALTARRAQRDTARLRTDLVAGTVELLQASADLIAHDAAGRRHSRLRALDAALTASARRSAVRRGLGSGIATLGVGLTSSACLALGIVAVRAGTIPGPALAVLALLPLATAELVAGLPEAAQRLLGAGHAAGRLADLDALPAPQTEPAAAEPVPAGGELAAEHLSVRWPDARRDAVQDVDLRIGHGRRLALTGRSGAGKSTVLAALMRYLDPSGGRVLLDDVDTRRHTGGAVRDRIAWCGPEAHLFDSTLRENLRLARPAATDDELRSALALARLGAWLNRLPDGLDTALGTHGTPVSGGERQRIGVARALLSDRPILLLDEPTAHLDAPTAAALAADVLASTEGRSTLVVTHRPADFANLPTVDLTAARSVAAA